MMRIRNTYGFITSALLAGSMLLSNSDAAAQGAADSTAAVVKPAGRMAPHQLRLGVDLRKVVESIILKDRSAYELSLDYLLNDKEIYGVLEGGFGSADFTKTSLRYTSTNTFVKVGFDKGLLKRIHPADWDAAFIGLRYGVAFINRGDANYVIADSLWGSTSGSTPGNTFTGHWAEITGGIRLELLPRIFAGWNVRGKFLLNPKSFAELPPAFIAGYGRGDRSTAFDFNFYILYALRWK